MLVDAFFSERNYTHRDVGSDCSYKRHLLSSLYFRHSLTFEWLIEIPEDLLMRQASMHIVCMTMNRLQ